MTNSECPLFFGVSHLFSIVAPQSHQHWHWRSHWLLVKSPSALYFAEHQPQYQCTNMTRSALPSSTQTSFLKTKVERSKEKLTIAIVSVSGALEFILYLNIYTIVTGLDIGGGYAEYLKAYPRAPAEYMHRSRRSRCISLCSRRLSPIDAIAWWVQGTHQNLSQHKKFAFRKSTYAMRCKRLHKADAGWRFDAPYHLPRPSSPPTLYFLPEHVLAEGFPQTSYRTKTSRKFVKGATSLLHRCFVVTVT